MEQLPGKLGVFGTLRALISLSCSRRCINLSQAVGTYAMTELRFAVSADVVLQINPRLRIRPYLLTVGTNWQNATNRFGDINARTYVASELAIFVKPWYPVVKDPAILPITAP